MTNYEKYKDKFIPILLDNMNCSEWSKLSNACENATGKCTKCRQYITEWLDAEYQEVDWTKVSTNTPVYVWNDKYDKKILGYFVTYMPNLKWPYLVFGDGLNQFEAHGIDSYMHAELVKE